MEVPSEIQFQHTLLTRKVHSIVFTSDSCNHFLLLWNQPPKQILDLELELSHLRLNLSPIVLLNFTLT